MEYNELFEKYQEVLIKYESLKNLIQNSDQSIGICKLCERVNGWENYSHCTHCNSLYCYDCMNICICDVYICKNCTKCSSLNCLNCCIKCTHCNKCNCNHEKKCRRCRHSLCDNCFSPNNDDFNRNCEVNTDSCNNCHYKKECVQCWNVSKYKYLPVKLQDMIHHFLICLKKSKTFPKPIINIILQYVVISNSNVFTRKITFMGLQDFTNYFVIKNDN